jgi:anti-anti-sigma regulatory factor
MTSSAAAADRGQNEQDLTEESSVQTASGVPTLAAEPAPIDPEAWQVIAVLPRLDSEHHADLMTEIHSALAEGSRRIALDLTQNRFFSLNAIQLCVSLARDLAGDDGALALIGCGERTKRHFDIYGSLKQITLVRNVSELVSGRTTSVIVRPRSGSSQDIR